MLTPLSSSAIRSATKGGQRAYHTEGPSASPFTPLGCPLGRQ